MTMHYRNKLFILILTVILLFYINIFELNSEKALKKKIDALAYPNNIKTQDNNNASFSKLLIDEAKLNLHAITLRHKGFEERCQIQSIRTIDEFFDYPKKNGKLSCKNLAELGGNKREADWIYPYNDGSRMVCLDKLKRNDCVVLSFGIGSDISFDLHVSKLLNCQVYMFDSTVDIDKSTLHSNMKFYSIGLHNKKGNLKIGDKFYKVDRYENIISKLNLTNRVIDYLKLDIESSEIQFFDDLFGPSLHLLKNIRQIGMEIHPCLFSEIEGKNATKIFQPYWDVMRKLECHGFHLISFVPNSYPVSFFKYKNREVQGCYDLEYLRID